MRTVNFTKSHIVISSAIVIVMACVISVGLVIYGFVVDFATSPIASYITNAYENSVDLQLSVERTYPAESVWIRFEDQRFLTVTLVNSAANQLAAEEQRAQAAEIARLAWQNGKVSTRVRYIKITFIERTRLLGIPLCHGVSYLFRGVDLPQD